MRDGFDLLLDPEGRELDGLQIARATLSDARSIIADDAKTGRVMLDQRIDVKDEAGTVVHSLDFADAVEIVYIHP